MIIKRASNDRGKANFQWLNSHHSFSFGGYYDPRHMGFGRLRVINEDRVIAGAGFPTHGHRDMEIISYVISGGLEHKDSEGNASVILPGELQRMTAGSGIRHSEYNASKSKPVHFLQIWIEPEKNGLKPGYEQTPFPEAERRNKLRLIGSQDGRDGSVTIHQDVSLYGSLLSEGKDVTHQLKEGRQAWIQMVKGTVVVNGTALQEGDGAGVVDETTLDIEAFEDAEFLLFDLAA